MSYKEQLFKDFGRYAGVPDDVTITDIEESSSYYQSCETCGGDMEYSVDIYGVTAEGKPYYKSMDGKIGDFLSSLAD